MEGHNLSTPFSYMLKMLSNLLFCWWMHQWFFDDYSGIIKEKSSYYCIRSRGSNLCFVPLNLLYKIHILMLKARHFKEAWDYQIVIMHSRYESLLYSSFQ